MIVVSACPVCGGQNLEPFTFGLPAPDRLHHAQVSCRTCGLIIAQPQASAEDMARYYRDSYYQEHWADAEGAFAENTEWYQRHELPLMRELWSKWTPPRGGSITEVGCGYGALLPLLTQDGYLASGCDPSPQAVRFCQSRQLHVVEGSAPGLPLRGPFDAVITQHVIEHVADPRAFVAELVGLTRPGGVVAIVTEDAWNAQYIWERSLSRILGRAPAFHTSSDHTYVFSASHLATMLRDAGCDDVRTVSFSYAAGPESLHWRLYKGAFRLLDRMIGHGDYLMAVGHNRRES